MPPRPHVPRTPPPAAQMPLLSPDAARDLLRVQVPASSWTSQWATEASSWAVLTEAMTTSRPELDFRQSEGVCALLSRCPPPGVVRRRWEQAVAELCQSYDGMGCNEIAHGIPLALRTAVLARVQESARELQWPIFVAYLTYLAQWGRWATVVHALESRVPDVDEIREAIGAPFSAHRRLWTVIFQHCDALGWVAPLRAVVREAWPRFLDTASTPWNGSILRAGGLTYLGPMLRAHVTQLALTATPWQASSAADVLRRAEQRQNLYATLRTLGPTWWAETTEEEWATWLSTDWTALRALLLQRLSQRGGPGRRPGAPPDVDGGLRRRTP